MLESRGRPPVPTARPVDQSAPELLINTVRARRHGSPPFCGHSDGSNVAAERVSAGVGTGCGRYIMPSPDGMIYAARLLHNPGLVLSADSACLRNSLRVRSAVSAAPRRVILA